MREERLRYITHAINAGRYLPLREIVERFSVDIQTARRDVAYLAEMGLLVKVHGGAMPTTELGTLSLQDRINLHDMEKMRIAQAAAQLVRDGETIILDGGSTTSYILPYLKGKSLQIVTNSVSVLVRLADLWPGAEVTVTGGEYYPKSAILLGPQALKSIQSIHADKYFLSAAGIVPEGVYNPNRQVVELERAMMAQATQTILLVDSSKFGNRSLVHLCELSALSTVVAGSPVPEEIANAVREAGVDLLEC